MELLKSAQLYQTNKETGKSGITLAGILLLGKDETILSAVSHHRTDLILRKVDLDRYDDRDLVCTNLIESYERIMAFIAKHLPDPFYLEGDMRISIRDAIFREVASNILIHREYLNAFPAKLIIERGRVRTENSNRPHGFGLIDASNFTPFPKNPIIGRFFREIGRADELGSGVRKLMKYGNKYGAQNPELLEGDIFRIIIYYPDNESFADSSPENRIESGVESGVESDSRALGQNHDSKRVLSYCQPDSEPEKGVESGLESGVESSDLIIALVEKPLGKMEIARRLGKARPNRYLNETVKRLLENGLVEYTIPEKPHSRLQKYQLTKEGWMRAAKIKHIK
jgi:ATP-dependent DNA helicase RecG